MVGKEKIEFNYDDFEKEWKENLKEVDEEIKAKLTDADKKFAAGFYYALDQLDVTINNVADEIHDGSEVLETIKRNIVEDAGERIKEYMGGEFEEVLTWIVEKYA